MEKKRFIIKKSIVADSMEDALMGERKARVDEIYIDNDYKGEGGSSNTFGFMMKDDDNDD